jgi:hypothetical protein
VGYARTEHSAIEGWIAICQEALTIRLNRRPLAEQFAKKIEGIDHGKEWAQWRRTVNLEESMRQESVKSAHVLAKCKNVKDCPMRAGPLLHTNRAGGVIIDHACGSVQFVIDAS